jgi:hypothetical protein
MNYQEAARSKPGTEFSVNGEVVIKAEFGKAHDFVNKKGEVISLDTSATFDTKGTEKPKAKKAVAKKKAAPKAKAKPKAKTANNGPKNAKKKK